MGPYPSAKKQLVYSTAQADWTKTSFSRVHCDWISAGKKMSPCDCPGYDNKQSDDEAPEMLEL